MDCDVGKLLECIQNRPAIYNFKLKEHSNRSVVDELWREVATDMNLTVTECKTKWTILRNSFNRSLREGRNTPSGPKCLKRRQWYLMESMAFLREFVGGNRKMSGSLDTSSQVEDQLEQQEACNSIEVISDNELEDGPSQTENSANQSPKKKITAAYKVADPKILFLKSRTKEPGDSENLNLTFFKCLIPDVDKLSDTRKRKFKLEVMTLLNRHLEEQENFEQFSQQESFVTISTDVATS